MLARRREVARLLILATDRPTDVIVYNHPLRAVKQEIVTRGLAMEMPLPYLCPDAVQAYVARRGGTLADTTPELGALLYKRTEGHPLFMAQLLADLLQQSAMPPGTQRVLPLGL